MTKKKKGFTLIELVVVMAIIAVLAALIIGAITLARQAQRNTTRQADAKTFQIALESYFGTNKSYPGTTGTVYKVYSSGLMATYLTNFPAADPNSSLGRVVYCPQTASTYNLYVVTEPTADPGATPTCAVPAGSVDFSVK